MAARRFEEILDQFYRWGYDEKGWSANTRRQYVNQVRASNRWLEDHRKVSVLYATPKDLKAWLFSTTPVARSRNHARQALKGFGVYLIDAGYVETNAAASLPALKEPRRIPRALPPRTAKKIENMARTFGPDVKALTLVFLYGGLRRNEARTLRWSDLDMDDGWFRFKGKGDVERAVPMHSLVRDALILWRKDCPSADWVFPGRHPDNPVSNAWIADRIHEVGGAVGVNLHPHLMRHTFATALLSAADGNLRTVQTALGHANIQTTSHYAKVWPADVQAAVKGLTFGQLRDIGN